MELQTTEHAPTPEQRRLVESTSGVGLPYNEIAALIGVDEATLLEHYGREIELGQAKASGQIAKAIYSKALDGDTASLKLWSQNQEKAKRSRGRPRGSVKTPIHRLAENSVSLPRSESLQIRELKRMLLESAGTNVVQKAIEIALNDDHPAQGAMLKLCMDRMLPVSLFEKEKNNRSAVTINITGIGEAPTIIEAAPGDVTDV
jgi:hypothetical protein